MEEKIYLWELDSVRNSDEECQIARETLFRELFVEGHVVVMTFNQLADGRWIAPILKKEENYNYFMQLFKMGAIRISPYGDIRTASQYTQNALQKALDKETDFKFSCMPIKKEERYLLKEVLNAVRYCDPERIRVDIESLELLCRSSLDLSSGSKLLASIMKEKQRLEGEQQNSGWVGEPAPFDIQVCTYYYVRKKGNITLKYWLKNEIKRLILIYRYVKLILLVSQEKTADNVAVEKATPFMDIMQAIFRIEKETLKKYDVRWENLFVNAARNLQSMTKEEKNANTRSYWYNQIGESYKLEDTRKKELCDFQKLLVDVCYNFTLESSIDGVYCAYDDKGNKEAFVNEFIKRMNDYFNLYLMGHHGVNQSNDVSQTENDDLNWKRVVDVRKDVQEYEEKKHFHTNKIWDKKVKMTQKEIPFMNYFYNIIMFFLINNIVEIFYNLFVKKCLSIECLWRSLFTSFLYIILIGLITALLSKLFKVPDILDIIGNGLHKYRNWRVYKKNRKKYYTP